MNFIINKKDYFRIFLGLFLAVLLLTISARLLFGVAPCFNDVWYVLSYWITSFLTICAYGLLFWKGTLISVKKFVVCFTAPLAAWSWVIVNQLPFSGGDAYAFLLYKMLSSIVITFMPAWALLTMVSCIILEKVLPVSARFGKRE